MVIEMVKVPGWAMASRRTTTAPIKTTNMTGFLIWTRGSNLRKASTSACRMIWRSKRLRASATPWGAAESPVGTVVMVGAFVCIIRRTVRG